MEEITKSKEDKAWVTVTRTINLGNYENVKLDAGYSRTLLEGEDAEEVLAEMQITAQRVVINESAKILKVQRIKGTLTKMFDDEDDGVMRRTKRKKRQ